MFLTSLGSDKRCGGGTLMCLEVNGNIYSKERITSYLKVSVSTSKVAYSNLSLMEKKIID